MPITINGNGAISGLGDIDGHDLETATLVVSGDTTIAPQAVGRATLFVDDSTNRVGINTTTPTRLLQVSDINPLVSVTETSTTKEVLLGANANAGFVGTETNHDFRIITNGVDRVSVLNGGNVGIGTTSPTAQLEIEGNVSSTTQFSGFQGLRIQNANGAAFGVTADINFVAGTTTNNRGAAIGVQYLSGSGGNDLYFATNGNAVGSNDTLSERMRINNAGSIMMGTSTDTGARVFIRSDNTTTDIVNSGALTTTSTFGVALQNLSAVSGSYMPLYWRISNGSATQGVGLSAQSVSSGTGAQLVCHRRNNNTQAINWITTSQGNISFPNGQGIDFSASEGSGASDSVLDDYEEGTWTPTLSRITSTPTVTYNRQTGRYIKVGGLVTIIFDIRTTAFSGGSGDCVINDLPYASTTDSNSGGYSAVQLRDSTAMPLAANENSNSSYVAGTQIYLKYMTSSNAESGVTLTSGRLTGFATYFVY